jgi:hypothetical protein
MDGLLMKSDFDIAKQFRKHLKTTKDGLASQYQNTRDCQAFYAGDLMDFWIGAASTDSAGVKKRAMVQINKVKPYVNAVKGFMAQNRRKAKYSARINGDKIQVIYSDYANGMADYVRRNTYADQKETQQDGDMLINGYGVMQTAMTYTNGQSTTSPNGQIKMGRVDPEQYGWDPFAKESGLMDRRWDFIEEIYALDDALNLFQDAKDDDFESADDSQLSGGEGGYKFYARGGRYNKIKETSIDWSDEKTEMVKVYFYEWYEYETFYRADNPLAKIQDPRLQAIFLAHLEVIAQEQDIDDDFSFDPKAAMWTFNDEVKKKLEKLFGNKAEIYEFRRKVFYSAVISKDHVFTKYRNPCQQGFTRKVKTGDYDAKNKIWTGMVNSMKEPTLYYNKGLTELMFIIGANSKGGVYIEEDAVDDHAKFEQQYAKTDAVIQVAPGALAAGKIQAKKEAHAVTGYEQIIQLMGTDIQDVTGIDRAFLGSSENKDETGILNRQRIRQVVSSLACYFDSITLYSIEHAQLLLGFMKIFAENNDGSLFSIQGQDGKAQFLQISKDKLISEYDTNIEEAPQSPEEKQQFAQILVTMADKLITVDPQSAKVLYAMAAKYLPLDSQDQQKVTQLLVPQQGEINPQMVAQMHDMLTKLTSQAAQVELAEKMSKANANNARAKLDTAKIPVEAANIRQKDAAAFHQVHEALLDEYVAKNDPHPQATV